MNYQIVLADDGVWELRTNDSNETLIGFGYTWNEFLESYYDRTGVVPELIDDEDEDDRTLLNYEVRSGRYSYEYEVADSYMEDVKVGEYTTFDNPFKSRNQAYDYCSNRKRYFGRHFSVKHNDDGTVTMKRYA